MLPKENLKKVVSNIDFEKWELKEFSMEHMPFKTISLGPENSTLQSTNNLEAGATSSHSITEHESGQSEEPHVFTVSF